MEGADPSRVMRDARALGQNAGEPPLAAKADDLDAIKKAVEDAAAISGGLWLSYLFVLFYIAIAAGAVTHEDLLLQRAVKLPFLNVELPLLAFFALAPFLFLVTHAYTLAHFVMLGKRASRFHEQLWLELPESEHGAGQRGPLAGSARKEIRDKLRWLLPSNIFVQMLAGPSELRGGVFGFILRAIALTTLVVFPVFLLLLLQIQFLPYHHVTITWAQRLALLLDIALLWALRPPVLAMPGAGGADRARHRKVRAFDFAVAGLLSTAALWLSIVIATIPGEWQEKWPTWVNPRLPLPVAWSGGKKAFTWITPRDFLFAGNVNGITQRRDSWASNTLVLPGFSLYEGLKIDEPKKLAWREYLVDLRGRDLDEAVLVGADLPRADLTGASLRGAYLGGTRLQGASLEKAQLQGSNLMVAQLEGAVLDEAQLQGASLVGAQLEGASLAGALLQGASLHGAWLEGASLDGAQLQGASLAWAQLQGASLAWAQLLGASLKEADIEAADFSNSFLWRSAWTNIKLRTIAFQSIKWGAKDWLKTQDSDQATLRRTPSYGLRLSQPAHPVHNMSEYYPYLVQMLEDIGAKRHEETLPRIERLNCDSPDKTLESCKAAEEPRPQMRELRNRLKQASVDDAPYKKALAGMLKKIACASSEDAIYFLRGIIYGGTYSPGRLAATGSEAIALGDFIQSHDCPVSASLTKNDKAALLQIHGKAYEDQGDFGHAIADYGRMIDLDPNDPNAYQYRGDAYEKNNDFLNAIADYGRMIELDPKDAYAYKNRGSAYDKEGDFDHAISDYNNAIERDPSDAAAHRLLGDALRAQGRTEEAIAKLRKAVELAPNDALVHQILGQGLLSQSKTMQAIVEFRKVVELAPRNAFARDDIGRALLNEGKIDAAVAEFRKAVEVDNKDPYAVLWLYLARTRGGHNATAELKTNAKKLKQPDWPYPVVELFLGRRTPEASLAAHTPNERCEAQFFVGEWHLLRGGHPEAIEALKAAVGTCPKRNVEYDFARAELQRLQP